MALEEAYKMFDAAAAETVEWFNHEIAGLRTGRITPDMVTDITIEHYGSRTPLQGLASVALLDARTLLISPWDSSALAAIEHALQEAQLGAQPTNDGKAIRLAFSQPTEEVREETVKVLHRKAEEARVRLRRSRDESLSIIQNDKKAGDITEDDFFAGRKQLDERIGKVNDTIAERVKSKEAEIRSI